MNTTWHRSETRDIRPFFGAVRAKDAVADSRIRLFEDRDPSTDTHHDIEEPDLQHLRPVIYPTVAPIEQWMPGGYTAGDFGLLVLGTNAFLRVSTILEDVPLDQPLPESVELSSDTLEELGGGRNLTLTVAVHLRTDRDPAPGRPFVVGHWLARKDFELKMPGTGRFFDVQFRKDEEWESAGYPAKTFYAVDYNIGIALPADAESSIATVYVHADLYTRMSTDGSGGLTKFLATEAIVQILQESFDEWKELTTVEPTSPLATILRKLDRGNLISISDLKALVTGSRKHLVRALLHDDVGLVRALV